MGFFAATPAPAPVPSFHWSTKNAAPTRTHHTPEIIKSLGSCKGRTSTGLLTIDFETTYGTGRSLETMPPILYVKDPETLIWGASVVVNGTGWWLCPADVADLLAALTDIDMADALDMLAHNAQFDGLILFVCYDFTVKGLWRDTLAMARAIFPHEKHDLNSMSLLLGLKGKVEGALEVTRNKQSMTIAEWLEFGIYAIRDGDQAEGVYHRLLPAFPADELELIDAITRMGCEPCLEIDVKELSAAYEIKKIEREQTILDGGVPQSVLSSNDQFFTYLQSIGLTPPLKPSPSIEGKMIPAFSKSDLQWTELKLERPDLHPLWMAREASKSTNELRRMERHLAIAAVGQLPMPLNYYGAHTGRLSGGGKTNPQNLKNGSPIRTTIYAPPGHDMLVCDSSQIELRFNAWFCGQTSSLDTLVAGKDIYVTAVVDQFGCSYEEIKAGCDNNDPKYVQMRRFGKAKELALGYQMGAPKFQTNLATGFIGMNPIYMTTNEAYEAVNSYRQSHAMINQMWATLQELVPAMMDPNLNHTIGPVTFMYEAVILPNGMQITYPDLVATEDGYMYANNKFIYGGLLLENVVQALARIAVTDQLLEARREKIKLVSMTHDENIGVAPSPDAPRQYDQLEVIMSRSPIWAPDLPLAAAGGYARNYSK